MATQTIQKSDLVTGEALLALPDDIGRYELIDGRLVEMAPASDEHGFIEFNLGAELRAFVRQRSLGRILGGEVGIYIRRNPDRIRGADIVFVSKTRLPELTDKFLEVTPELIVEIMSPNDTWEMIQGKLADYFSIGVDQVWVVEPQQRTVRVYRALTEVETFGPQDTLVSRGVLDGFRLEIKTLFEG